MIVFNTGRLLLSGLLGRLLSRLLGGLLLVLLLLKSLLGSDLLHNLLLLNEESTENATPLSHNLVPFNSIPITQALVAEVTTISTGDRALASTNSLHISAGNAGNLSNKRTCNKPYSSEGLLAATTLDGAGSLLGVLDNQSGTYTSCFCLHYLPGVFTMWVLLETVL